jgi:hypothetical protein
MGNWRAAAAAKSERIGWASLRHWIPPLARRRLRLAVDRATLEPTPNERNVSASISPVICKPLRIW